ncbi:hypothetical protein THAOC_06396 [Thalassiosira oceanica]|uniref:EGF-like domain-containing protein n=1 Tax=Thalassiosira oceanica TaxID=159749 RepID=K0T311_THAOC|nr:hypothetical protein THAOC_06396 [Thalassiosira oceanica]|eukprot:EJK72105.1 hypothetical protein THAOC_06396 [Thalassiosira oceanica]
MLEGRGLRRGPGLLQAVRARARAGMREPGGLAGGSPGVGAVDTGGIEEAEETSMPSLVPTTTIVPTTTSTPAPTTPMPTLVPTTTPMPTTPIPTWEPTSVPTESRPGLPVVVDPAPYQTTTEPGVATPVPVGRLDDTPGDDSVNVFEAVKVVDGGTDPTVAAAAELGTFQTGEEPSLYKRECQSGSACDVCGIETDGSIASFCANGGVCNSLDEYVGSNLDFRPCECPVGFSGEHCEVELEIGYEMSTTTRPTEQVGAEDEHMLLLMDGHCGESFEEAFLKCTPCIAGPLGPQDDPTCADPSHQCFKTQGCRYDPIEFKVELGVTLYSSEGGAAELDGADLMMIANATMHFLNSMGRRHGVLLSSATALYGSATDITYNFLSFELTFLIVGYLRSETVTDGFGVKGILSGLIADHPREYVDALVYGAAEAGRDLSFFERVLVRKEDDAIGMEDVPAPPGRPPCRIDCLNGGLCMPAGVDYDYPKADYCNCTTAVVGGNPHAGERCEHPATASCMALGSETKHSFCTHGGECVSIVEDHDFHQGCVCPVGWGGAKCELALESIAPTPSHSFYFEDEVLDYKSVGVGFCLDASRNTYSKLIPEKEFESAISCPKVCNLIFGMGMHSFEYSSTRKCACLFDRDNAPEAMNDVKYSYSTELGLGRGSVAGTSWHLGVLCYAALEPEQSPAPTVYVPAPAVYDASLDCACGVDWMDAYTNCKPTCTIDKDCLQLGPDYKCQCYTTCQTKVEALPPKIEEVQEEETFDVSGWDLADKMMAERFFQSSDLKATITSNVIDFTLRTPVASTCGVSVIWSPNGEQYEWEHFHSGTISGTISFDHIVAVNIDGYPSFFEDELADSVVFRFFAFLSYGRGTLVSRMYAVKLPDITNTMEQEKLLIYELEYSNWLSYNYADPTNSGVDALNSRATLSAPLHLEDYFGESPLATSQGPNFKRGPDEESVQAHLYNGMIELHLRIGANFGCIAGSFYFGLNPTPSDSGGRFSVQAFDDSDGLDEDGQAIIHGLAQFDYSVSALIPQNLLPNSVWNNPASTSFVAGATWIDGQMNIHHSMEISSPLLNFVPPVSPPVQEEDDVISSLCPPDLIRNLIKDARISEVSSEYSLAYSAKNAIDGDASTEWATQGDGDRAYITFELRSEANVVSVGFHSRTTGYSDQIYIYQLEVGDFVTECELPDAKRSYTCKIGDRIGSRVKFQAIITSGGNVGAADISINGCLSDEVITPAPAPPSPPPTYAPTVSCNNDEKAVIAFRCMVDSDCFVKVRSRQPFCPETGVPLCSCYASWSRNPFDECEGQDGDLCREVACDNSCENLKAICYQPNESSFPRCEVQYSSDSEQNSIAEYQPVYNETLSVSNNSTSLQFNATSESDAGHGASTETTLPDGQSLDETGQISKPNTNDTAEYIPTCESDEDCLAAIRTLVPEDSSSYDIGICDCYALSRINPLDECEGKENCVGDQSCGICVEVKPVCSTGRCILVQDEVEDAAPLPTIDYDIASGAFGLMSDSGLVTAALLLMNLLF